MEEKASNCVSYGLEPCINCSFQTSFDIMCLIEWYKVAFQSAIVSNALTCMKTHPAELEYIFAAINLYYPEYESRIRKLMVLL